MSAATQPIKVMQVIARMNVGGPAVIVAELMRGMDSSKYQQTLVTGYCADDEADYDGDGDDGYDDHTYKHAYNHAYAV